MISGDGSNGLPVVPACAFLGTEGLRILAAWFSQWLPLLYGRHVALTITRLCGQICLTDRVCVQADGTRRWDDPGRQRLDCS